MTIYILAFQYVVRGQLVSLTALSTQYNVVRGTATSMHAL